MARQRTIAPGYFKNEELGECTPFARLLFAGLWCWADREGRVEDRPKKLRAEILPYDHQADGDELVAELERHGLVGRYEACGVKVLEILEFKKYQNPHPREAASILPARDGTFQGEPEASPGQTQGEPQEEPSPARPSRPSRSSRSGERQSAPAPATPREAGAAARVAILGRDETFATAHPRTAALLAALQASGSPGTWPRSHDARVAVEAAIGAQDPIAVAVRVAEAIRASSKPWLGNHLEVIRPPAGGGGGPRKIFVGFADDGFTPVYRESQ